MGVFDDIFGGIIDWIQAIVDWANDNFHTLYSLVNSLYDGMASAFANVSGYFWNSYRNIVDAAGSAWDSTMSVVPGSFLNPFDYAIAKANAVSVMAIPYVRNVYDMVQLITQWVVSFVIGLVQGTFYFVEHGIEKGFLPLKAFFLATAAGAYQFGLSVFGVPVQFLNAYWDTTWTLSYLAGPLAPLVVAMSILLIIVLLACLVKWTMTKPLPWVLARIAERG